MRIAGIIVAIAMAGGALSLVTGCSDDDDDDAENCLQEGESVPSVADPLPCCEGLEQIPPKDSTVGILGICTAGCGNGTCDVEIESANNCPEDCD